MRRDIEFRTPEDAICVLKPNGTEVQYHIFSEYEIHLNKILPHTEQEWHYHSTIEETIVVTKGRLCCEYLVGSERAKRSMGPGEVVRVKNSIHTFRNDTDETAEFIVFRFVPDGRDKRAQIKGDKTVVARDAALFG